MSRFPTTRLSQWLPGARVLAAAAGIAALLGIFVGARSWPVYLVLIVAALFGIGWLERVWTRRRDAAPAPKDRGRLKVIRGGRAGYDLAKDNSTDNQKYVM